MNYLQPLKQWISLNDMRQRLYEILEGEKALYARIYNCSMFVVVMASLLPLMLTEYHHWFREVEIATTLIFILDYLVRWYVSPITINKGKTSYYLYPFRLMAIIDLLSILPIIDIVSPAFRVLRVVRLLKLFRIFRLLRLSDSVLLFFKILKKEQQLLLSVLLIALMYIFVTALIMFNVEPRINPNTGNPTFSSFFDAFYWATVTLTTVGYGDLCPVTNVGRLISILSSLFGVAIIALPSGVITASYLEELKSSKLNKTTHK